MQKHTPGRSTFRHQIRCWLFWLSISFSHVHLHLLTTDESILRVGSSSLRNGILMRSSVNRKLAPSRKQCPTTALRGSHTGLLYGLLSKKSAISDLQNRNPFLTALFCTLLFSLSPFFFLRIFEKTDFPSAATPEKRKFHLRRKSSTHALLILFIFFGLKKVGFLFPWSNVYGDYL